MKIVELRPVRTRKSDWDAIESRLIELFRQEIYLPLIAEIDLSSARLKNSMQNSLDELAHAILTRRIQFAQGKFTGRFSAALSRELYRIGARRDVKHGCFRIPLSKLPVPIRAAISQSEVRFETMMARLDRKLEQILPADFTDNFHVESLFDRAIWHVDKELRGSLKAITIQPELTKEQRERIADEWANNMKLSIKGWTNKEVRILRQKMQEHVFAGRRYEDVIKTIQSRYGVAKSKAKFLARQETSLLMSKFKETRYQQAGVDEYYWVCVVGSPQHPVRPMHKELARQSILGKIFKFSDPPIDSPDGSKHNPGENYNCRCTARPVIRFK